MTSERIPNRNEKYKQVMTKPGFPKPYTSCTMGLDDYLTTNVWQKLRLARLKKDHYRCHECGTGINVSVHHIHYPEIWGEEDIENDLVTLCDKCHAEVHKNDIGKE